MLKTLGLTTTISLLLVGFMPTPGLADPRPTFSYPSTNLDDSTLFCYMQTADGRTLDLGRICGRPASSSQRAVEAAPALIPAPIPAVSIPSSNVSREINLTGSESNPIPNAAGLRNDANPTCFVFDSQGRPCAAQS